MKTDNIHIRTFSNKRRSHKASGPLERSLFDSPLQGGQLALKKKKDLTLTSDQLENLIEAIELDEAIHPMKKPKA